MLYCHFFKRGRVPARDSQVGSTSGCFAYLWGKWVMEGRDRGGVPGEGSRKGVGGPEGKSRGKVWIKSGSVQNYVTPELSRSSGSMSRLVL